MEKCPLPALNGACTMTIPTAALRMRHTAFSRRQKVAVYINGHVEEVNKVTPLMLIQY
jgi:hypothetical protein